MHYDIHYSGTDTAEDRKRALQDIIDYMGKRRFHEVSKTVGEMTMSPGGFAIAVSFAGVQGYPVKVWYDHIYGAGEWAAKSE